MPSLPKDVPLVRMEGVGMAAQMAEYALYVALRKLRDSEHPPGATRECTSRHMSLR